MKTVLITGAASGIGRALSLRFAKAGYNIIINYSQSKDAALDLEKQCQNFGVKTLVVGCDVKKSLEVNEMVKLALEKFGTIEVLINNSGITKDGLLLRMKEEDFDAVMETNLKGTFNVTQAISKNMMKERFGKIINMSSVIGLMGNAGQSNYAASKAGIIGFTKSLAKELASRNITVNAIAPGFIETKMTEVLSSELKDSILKQIPLSRFGKAEDVAEAAHFLASDSANYITGQVIQVDGGMVM